MWLCLLHGFLNSLALMIHASLEHDLHLVGIGRCLLRCERQLAAAAAAADATDAYCGLCAAGERHQRGGGRRRRPAEGRRPVAGPRHQPPYRRRWPHARWTPHNTQLLLVSNLCRLQWPLALGDHIHSDIPLLVSAVFVRVQGHHRMMTLMVQRLGSTGGGPPPKSACPQCGHHRLFDPPAAAKLILQIADPGPQKRSNLNKGSSDCATLWAPLPGRSGMGTAAAMDRPVA